MSRIRLTRAALAAALAAVGLAAVAGAAPPERVAVVSAPATAPQHHVAVDPQLRAQLRASRTGRVDAVVTTWTRAGLAEVERLGVRGTRLKVLPMILTRTLTPEQLRRLERSPHVRSVWANTRYQLHMEDTTWITRARYAWSNESPAGAPPGLGVTGKDVHVAVIDTGADGQHEDMDNLVEFCDTTPAVSGSHQEVLCSPWLGPQFNAGPAGPTNTARGDARDDNDHGTHVSGTVAGSGSASGGRAHPHSTIGIAPEAKLHVYKANVGASLLQHQILASYDDIVNKKLKGVYNVVAINNSYGGGTGSDYNPSSPQHIAFKRAWDAGIVPVFSAGNSGPEHNTLGSQCVSPWVVCVAANTKPDSVVMFSSRGRPAEPEDTNRDGIVGGAGDVPHDNHDRRLAQAFDRGVYRPTLTAPGVSINAAKANSPACRETGATGDPASAAARGCYVPLNGTSMSAPHVTGAVPLIVEAFRQANKGRYPSAGVIADILERSAGKHELPGWRAEEQGAGRLDVYTAVRVARSYPHGSKEPALSTARVLYETHPGSAASRTPLKGCTGTLSWTARDISNPLLDPVDQPPLATERYGQHFISVPERTERLRITVRWPRHPGANLYLRLWRPGVDPDTAEQPLGGQTRALPDNEFANLVYTASQRLIEVRAPEETAGTPGAIPSGLWILRVYHRANGVPSVCDTNSNETPKLVEGFNYDVVVERPRAQQRPSTTLSAPQEGSTHTNRWVTVNGNASFPPRWEGVTWWEVRGTGTPGTVPEEPDPDNRPVFHFHGNKHVAVGEDSDPREALCTGFGSTDVATCSGPFLLRSDDLSPFPAAVWHVPNPLLNGGTDRNPIDPNWTWWLTEPVSVGGPMTVEWWASCGACERLLGITADWRIRLWADGALKVEQRVTATPALPNVAEKLQAIVNVPSFVAQNRIVLQVDPVYIDSQNNTNVYYDSELPCPTAVSEERCDSIVKIPLGDGGDFGTGPGPTNVRVTDVHSGLRVAWDPVPNATRYEVHRSRDPAFVPGNRTRVARTTGTPCTAPSNPTWPTVDRPAICWVDGGNEPQQWYYYRVIAVVDGKPTNSSQLAYGMRTLNDAQARIKVDRLYAPQIWEHATWDSTPTTSYYHRWDTLELIAGPHTLWARVFEDGIGSTKDRRTVVLAGDRPSQP
ncbi:MAG TPA: S8 family serine peptidase [Gaiellaceae bacterium]|nr:S8 family serine peptidase [Gaiellaceae bacterium]